MEGAIETFEPMAAPLRNLLGLRAGGVPTELLAAGEASGRRGGGGEAGRRG